MSESLLIADIRSWLTEHARGNANAKPRRLLLAYLNSQGHSIDDRRMRKAYETMELVGSHSKGIFWIMTAEDRRIAQSSLHGRAMSELVREKRIRESAPVGQMGLWDR